VAPGTGVIVRAVEFSRGVRKRLRLRAAAHGTLAGSLHVAAGHVFFFFGGLHVQLLDMFSFIHSCLNIAQMYNVSN